VIVLTFKSLAAREDYLDAFARRLESVGYGAGHASDIVKGAYTYHALEICLSGRDIAESAADVAGECWGVSWEMHA